MFKYVSIQIAGYRGWILQQYNVAPFCDRLEELLISNFTSQMLCEVELLSKSDDREVYRLKALMKDQMPGSSESARHFSMEEVYIKRYATINWKQKVQTLFHVHKAQKSWGIGKNLVKRGIPTPLPIAYVTRKIKPSLRRAGGGNPLRGGVRGGSSPLACPEFHRREGGQGGIIPYQTTVCQGGVKGGTFPFEGARGVFSLPTEHILVTQGIENGVQLADYVRQYVQENPEFLHERLSLKEKRELIQCVAEFLAKLHVVGIYHGDFTTRNILVEDRRQTLPSPPQGGTTPPSPPQGGTTPPCFPSREKTSFRIYLIDLDSVRSTHWISDRRRIKNLDELGRNFLDLRVFSTSDRGSFLKHYLRANPKETRTFKELFKCVFQRTQKRLRKYGHHFIPPPNPHKGRFFEKRLLSTPDSHDKQAETEKCNAVVAAESSILPGAGKDACTPREKPLPESLSNFSHRGEGMYRGWNLHVFPRWKETFPDINTVWHVLSNPVQTVQENTRGVVLLACHNGTLFVAKRSKIQESKRWAQFTSLYRQGEGIRALRNMMRLYSLGLPVPEPVLVLQKRVGGFVVASWSFYRYLEGHQCNCAQARLIAETLKEIHQKGWVHRDPHVKNFLLDKQNIYIIDCAKARSWRFRYAQMYDVVLLNNCCPGSLTYYGISESYWVYRLAKFHNNMIKRWRRIKRQIRGSYNSLRER